MPQEAVPTSRTGLYVDWNSGFSSRCVGLGPPHAQEADRLHAHSQTGDLRGLQRGAPLFLEGDLLLEVRERGVNL